MKIRALLLAGTMACLLVAGAGAIDRDARIVESIGVYGQSLDDSEGLGVHILSEIATATPDGDWAFLAGAGWGRAYPDGYSDDPSYWQASLGLKYYISTLTSMSLVGSYRDYYDPSGSPYTTSGVLGLKHRLVSANNPLSPFLTAAVIGRRADELDTDDSDTFWGGALGFGCDFAMNDSLVFVLEGAYTMSESGADVPEADDGFLAAFKMKYYWPKPRIGGNM